MDDVEVEVVRAKAFQGAFYLAADRFAGKVSLVEIDFGGKHHFVPCDIALYRPAEILLARPCRIAVGGVEEINAEIEGVFYDGLARIGIQRPRVHIARRIAETHAAEAEPRHLDPAVA